MTGFVYQDMRQTGPKEEKRKDSRGTDKGKKVPVVAAADTVVKPDTMVVQGLDAIIANTTVIAARRSPDVACLAVLHRHIHCSHFGGCQLDHDPIICRRSNCQRVIRGVRDRHRVQIARNDARINNGRVHKR